MAGLVGILNRLMYIICFFMEVRFEIQDNSWSTPPGKLCCLFTFVWAVHVSPPHDNLDDRRLT